MLVALQLEQVDVHPLQVPLATTNPLLQTVHIEELVQVMQFRGQLPVQELPVRVFPGGQAVQVVGVPTQVTQLLSQAMQVEELDKKEPAMHPVQTLLLVVEQEMQFRPHFIQREAVESKAYPFMQLEHVPLEQSLHPGLHSLTCPSDTVPVIPCPSSTLLFNSACMGVICLLLTTILVVILAVISYSTKE
jgi:hypothetical protein